MTDPRLDEILENIKVLLKHEDLLPTSLYLIGSALTENFDDVHDLDLIFVDDEAQKLHKRRAIVIKKMAGLYDMKIEFHEMFLPVLLNAEMKIPSKAGILRFHLLENSRLIHGLEIDFSRFSNSLNDLIELNKYYLAKDSHSHDVCNVIINNPAIEWKRPWTKKHLISQMKDLKLISKQ